MHPTHIELVGVKRCPCGFLTYNLNRKSLISAGVSPQKGIRIVPRACSIGFRLFYPGFRRTSLCFSKGMKPSTWSSSIRWMVHQISMPLFPPVRICLYLIVRAALNAAEKSSIWKHSKIWNVFGRRSFQKLETNRGTDFQIKIVSNFGLPYFGNDAC